MPTTDLVASELLSSARRKRAEAAALEVGIMLDGLAWCRLHEVVDELDAATWHEVDVPIAGPGAPWVAEFCVAEFGAAMGISTDSARAYLGHALELKFRLPRVWERVLAGELPVWRARRIAEQTIPLSVEAAGFVDQNIAPFAHKSGPAVTDRLVEDAILRFMPQRAAELAADAADGRFVRINHDHAAGTGMSSIEGTLDTADALDVEEALQRGAETLKAAGSEDSLDVRRSVALGELARGQESLDLPRGRDLTLYVHLDPDSDVVMVENAGGHLITQDTLARWISTGDAKVVVKPVIDLNKPISTSAYAIPDRIREHVILRDPRCVFPHCNRRARRADLDHIHAYDEGGSTSTENLAPLCRFHHRLKTHGSWTYSMVEPGIYLWRSPHGYSYLRDRDGTQDLTPRPVEPPGFSRRQ